MGVGELLHGKWGEKSTEPLLHSGGGGDARARGNARGWRLGETRKSGGRLGLWTGVARGKDRGKKAEKLVNFTTPRGGGLSRSTAPKTTPDGGRGKKKVHETKMRRGSQSEVSSACRKRLVGLGHLRQRRKGGGRKQREVRVKGTRSVGLFHGVSANAAFCLNSGQREGGGETEK